MAVWVNTGLFSQALGDSWQWEPVGIGGGGRLMNPAFSPHDPGLALCSSDMGGAYRSEDGGNTWTMIPQAMLKRLQFAYYSNIWMFHPSDPRVIFVGSIGGMARSADAGKTWQIVEGDWNAGLGERERRRSPRVIAFNPRSPDLGLAFFMDIPQRGHVTVYATKDRGKAWFRLSELPGTPGGVVNAVYLSDASAVVAGTERGVFRSEDGGLHWEPAKSGLPESGELLDFEGAGSKDDNRFYASVTAGAGTPHALFQSRDGGWTWTVVSANRNADFRHLAISASNPRWVYASVEGLEPRGSAPAGQAKLYRSEDEGKTWTPIWNHDAHSPHCDISNLSWLSGLWGWNYGPSGIAVDPVNPSRVLTTTITSTLLSTDGGNRWRQVHAPEGTAQKQPRGGMMITSVWNYYVLPSNPSRHFAALTDFSGWRSLDGGENWQYKPDGNPWHNNTYAMAFDPDNPDLLWAACSVGHDLPTWKYQADLGTYAGGVVQSNNGAASWMPVDPKAGLPGKAVTDLWLDPSSEKGRRHLWAAVPAYGLYESRDNGATWSARNHGFDADNLNLLRVRGGSHGRLYALSTVRIGPGGVRRPGALYVSRDQGVSWRKIFSLEAHPFLTWFAFDPNRPESIYVSALHTAPGDTRSGGLWKTDDDGAHWARVLDKPTYATIVDPRDSNRVYTSCWLGQGDGLYTSADGGRSWARVDSYPYWQPLTMTFDPRDSSVLYVTNFGGGVFRGTRHDAQ